MTDETKLGAAQTRDMTDKATAWDAVSAARQDERNKSSKSDVLRDALEGLAAAVGNMRVPQTVADVALMMTVTLGPAYERAKEVLGSFPFPTALGTPTQSTGRATPDARVREALENIANGDWGYISPEYATDKSRIRTDISRGNNVPYMGKWGVIARDALAALTPQPGAVEAEALTELLALADRIEQLPTYSGEELGAKLRELGQPKGTGTFEPRVMLIHEKWRRPIVDALRSHTPSPVLDTDTVEALDGVIAALGVATTQTEVEPQRRFEAHQKVLNYLLRQRALISEPSRNPEAQGLGSSTHATLPNREVIEDGGPIACSPEIMAMAKQLATERGHRDLDHLITCTNGCKVPVWQFYVPDAVSQTDEMKS
jgi:hypothetical protein